jgi:phosphotransferase system HPr (HPr) family protein
MTVTDPIGLHARPIGHIVSLVRDTGATVVLRNEAGTEASATSALKMLSLKVKTGETLELIIEESGSLDREALATQLEHLINQA